MPIRFLLTLLAMLFLTPDPAGGGDPPDDPEEKPEDKPDPTKDDPPAPKTFTQDELNTLLAKERKDTEDRVRRKADEDRENDEAEKRGEFETVKKNLTDKLAQAEADRDAAQTRLDEALKVITTTVEASWQDAPEEVRDLYDGEDDPLAKQAFLSKPATAKLIERLTKAKAPHIPRDPKPGGTDKDTDVPPALPRAKIF